LGLKDSLSFGRNKGKTVEETMLADVGWLVWLRSEQGKAKMSAFNTEVNELLDDVVRADKQLHKKFGSEIGKWKEWGGGVMITSPDTPAPVAVPPVERVAQRGEGWGVW
jgi:hypothetical protein